MISASSKSDRSLANAESPAALRTDLHEICQTLLRRIGWPGNDNLTSLHTLGFTSCSSGEGVSTIATQVAISAATAGTQRVLLVDLNFVRPKLHPCLGASPTPGVYEVVAGLPLENALQESSFPNLQVLASGASDSDAQRCHPAGLARLIKDAQQKFDLVLFDLPSCDQASTTLSVAGLLDGVCLVVEAERVRSEVARRTIDLLARCGATLIGTVFNKQPQHVPHWLYRTL